MQAALVIRVLANEGRLYLFRQKFQQCSGMEKGSNFRLVFTIALEIT